MTTENHLLDTKANILIVDDGPSERLILKRQLRERFNVFTAENPEEAIALMMKISFAAAMIDINLGMANGFELGDALRDAKPDMAIIIMSGVAGNFRDSHPGFDDYIVKWGTDEVLIGIVENAIYKKTMNSEIRLRRLQLLYSIYPYRDALVDVYRRVIKEDGGELEKLVGRLKHDNSCIAWNVYKLHQHENVFTTSVASTLGCIGRCKFCRHGYRRIERLLEWEEIVSQALYGLDSLLAKGVFEEDRPLQPCLHFTGMGEPLSNWDNVSMAIKVLAAEIELAFGFIITTIGIESDLVKMVHSLKSFMMDLSRFNVYLSLNFPDPAMRSSLMPAVKDQDLSVTRNLLFEVEAATGNIPTVSIILIPGLNDRQKDIGIIARDWKDFRIKLQAFAPSPGFAPYPTATQEELQSFQQSLFDAGVKHVRIRKVIGGSENAGCGSDMPDPELMS